MAYRSVYSLFVTGLFVVGGCCCEGFSPPETSSRDLYFTNKKELQVLLDECRHTATPGQLMKTDFDNDGDEDYIIYGPVHTVVLENRVGEH